MPEGSDREMPDPVTGAVVLAKAMGSSGSEAERAAGNLLTRLLGPSVDAFGAGSICGVPNSELWPDSKKR